MTSSQIDPGIPRVPARQVILSAAALWLCYFLLITVRGLVVELGAALDAVPPASDLGELPQLGVSAAMRSVEATLRKAARVDVPVVLTGETGVGKEVAARFLHAASARGAHPFVAVTAADTSPQIAVVAPPD